MINTPNSLYFMYENIKLVQFYNCYYFVSIHKILVPPLTPLALHLLDCLGAPVLLFLHFIR